MPENIIMRDHISFSYLLLCNLDLKPLFAKDFLSSNLLRVQNNGSAKITCLLFMREQVEFSNVLEEEKT